MSEALVIVGDGIAGPALARSLAEQEISSALIVRRDFEDSPVFEPGPRTTTPVVRQDVVEQLGISVADQAPTTGVQFFAGGRKLELFSRALMSRAGLTDCPFYALDALQVSNELLEYAANSPKIEIIQGSVTDVDVAENSLVGLKIGDETMQTSLVFDATGRHAGIATLVKDKYPQAVESSSDYQPTTYLGAYVRLEDVTSRHFPDADTILSLDFLSNGVRIFLVPHRVEGSEATHLCFVSGDKATIGGAFRSARANQGSMDNSHLVAIRTLTQDTIWQEVLDCVVDVDRTVYFNYINAQSRIARIGGLAMIGDAHVHVNPVAGVGYRHIAHDIQTFLATANRSQDLKEAGQRFNIDQREICAQRIKTARRVATTMKYGRSIGRVLL